MHAKALGYAGFLCALFASPLSQAAPVTSTADPALAGAVIETFDNAASGSYNPVNLNGVTITGASPMTINSDLTAQFGVGGQSLNNNLGVPTAFTLTFDTAVSAFGIFSGALNNAWTWTAYDASNNVIEVATTPDDWRSATFYGMAAAGIKSVSFDGKGDWAVFDNLYFVPQPDNHVPEPGSLALAGLGLAGILGLRRRRLI